MKSFYYINLTQLILCFNIYHMSAINITKTIRTKKSTAETVINIARNHGYSYSRLHSDIDDIMLNEEIAQEIFKILQKKHKQIKRKLVKLTDEELAIYADDNTQPQTILAINPRTYPVTK
jgi:ribulose-5-phosphate 4-epimerase/fuculose-1-phosphate aldolase